MRDTGIMSNEQDGLGSRLSLIVDTAVSNRAASRQGAVPTSRSEPATVSERSPHPHLLRRIARQMRPTRIVHPDKLILVRTTPQLCSPAFIALAASVGESRAFISSRARTTAGQTGFRGSDLRSMPIPLPQLSEQLHRPRNGATNEWPGKTGCGGDHHQLATDRFA
jgi:hypothetical protein